MRVDGVPSTQQGVALFRSGGRVPASCSQRCRGSCYEVAVPLIPPETIEQIQAANDIVDVVGSYIALKRAGAVFKARCPFHDERTPSFTVNPQRQIFKCFGCGAGGSVIRFVMNYEQLDFISAAKKLAERAGIKIVEAELSADDQARVSMRRRLLALHAEAAEWFHQQLLKKPSAQIARDYLKSRGISGDVAKSWKLGFAPEGWDAMREMARGSGFSDAELVASGLVKTREEEATNQQSVTRDQRSFYDRFRARVMFPICNDTGEVIAFSGRVLEADAKAAKYVNSPETMLFTKGAVLFGLHKSKRALIDKGSAIVCEGQLDLITAFEAGVQNVIAPQGTAFTDRQARILKRYVEQVVLCFDSDAAGEKAAERSLQELLSENLLVRVAEMPPGEDPDSLIRSDGAAAFRDRVDQAKDFFDWRLEREMARPDFATSRGRTHAARKLAESISLISDPLVRETVVNRASVRLEVSAQELARLLRDPKRAPAEEPIQRTELAWQDRTLKLLALVSLRDVDARAWIAEQPWPEAMEAEPNAELLQKILAADLDPEQPQSVTAFLATLNAAEEAALTGLLGEKVPENATAIAQDCWRELERRRVRRRIDSLQTRMRATALGAEELLQLQKEIIRLQQFLTELAQPVERSA